MRRALFRRWKHSSDLLQNCVPSSSQPALARVECIRGHVHHAPANGCRTDARISGGPPHRSLDRSEVLLDDYLQRSCVRYDLFYLLPSATMT